MCLSLFLKASSAQGTGYHQKLIMDSFKVRFDLMSCSCLSWTTGAQECSPLLGLAHVACGGFILSRASQEQQSRATFSSPIWGINTPFPHRGPKSNKGPDKGPFLASECQTTCDPLKGNNYVCSSQASGSEITPGELLNTCPVREAMCSFNWLETIRDKPIIPVCHKMALKKNKSRHEQQANKSHNFNRLLHQLQ